MRAGPAAAAIAPVVAQLGSSHAEIKAVARTKRLVDRMVHSVRFDLWMDVELRPQFRISRRNPANFRKDRKVTWALTGSPLKKLLFF